MSDLTETESATPAAAKLTVSGQQVAEVELDIDYQIIEHFSEHLYGSPNKAVEELVANGFDAFAQRTFVYTPGRFTTARVAVWDDGWSMDEAGLQALWWIARSPKDSGERIIVAGDGTTRQERRQIGKFGIGKLASYSVGSSITHLCRRDSRFLLVSVDYGAIKGGDGQGPASKSNPVHRPIMELDEAGARSVIEQVFDGEAEPKAVSELFDAPTWTLAIIGGLKKQLKDGRLGWVLRNGMPLRPDFNVWLNDVPVVPKLEAGAAVEWDFSSDELTRTLLGDWNAAAADPKIPGIEGSLTSGKTPLDPKQPGKDIPFVEFPALGRVWGMVRLFEQSIATGRAAEYGRSHGFFVYVRGRLLNEDDDKLLLHEPSYATFYSSQFLLNVDGLDEDLLADRERLRQDTRRTSELRLLQVAVYRAARAKLTALLEEKEDRAKSVSLLPVNSREYFREPLTALLMKAEEPSELAFNLSHPTIERESLGDSAPLAALTPDGFRVNVAHPYYRALEKRMGTGKKAREFFRAYDMFAVADRLLEGYLYDLGIADETARQILDWKDGLLREMAENYETAPSDLAMELRNASYLGKEQFETAIAGVLNAIGFRAERFGESGEKDVLLAATIGPHSYTLTFEGKGHTGKALPNDSAEVGGAVNHRDKAGAEHAVIVARKFAGFDRPPPEGPAILGECKSAGGVSIMEVDALIELMQAVEEFNYPLDMLKEVFTTLESPDEKLARIRELRSPTEDFNYREVLEDIWDRQGRESGFGDAVPYKTVWQERSEWRTGMAFEDFERKLVALETLAGGRIRLLAKHREIYLLQSPERIAEQIERSLGPR